MTHLWVNQHAPDQTLPRATHARGCEIFDDSGRRYLDGSGGPALFSLGYSHPEVVEAITRQLSQVQFAYSTTFTSDAIDGLAEAIAAAAGPELRHTSFVSGGSEAVETCLKIAVQYHLARGEPGRTRFIARRQSWHGYTLGALSVSGHLARRRPYEALLHGTDFVSPANAYRPPPGFAGGDLAAHLAAELEQTILRVGPGRVAAFLFEPVVGAAGGAVPAPPGYAAAMRAVCDRWGVLMIADEVMCGIGRCGTFRALAHDGVAPDIMAIAKGLGGGYVPLGAAVYTPAVYHAIAGRFGTVASVHTYSGHTLACAAGLAVMRVIARDGLVDACARLGARLMAGLRQRLGGHAAVGDIRGRGLFVAVELVADRQTGRPFAPALHLHDRVRRACLDRGLICYPSGGTVDGLSGDHVLLSPPYIVTDAEIDEMVDTLAAGIDAALAGDARI
jgi:adenosylmethionine-8-amino-7-oxononanoate aminotransferase